MSKGNIPIGEAQASPTAGGESVVVPIFSESGAASRSRSSDRGTLVAARTAHAIVALLSAQQRERFARGLTELAIASMGVSRDAGDFLPKPLAIGLSQDWFSRFEKFKEEFVAFEGDHAPRKRIVERLNRELLLAPNARSRARRCLRLARQLGPPSDELELALACHRAARRAPQAVFEKLFLLASTAQSSDVRARAWLAIGGLQIRKLQLRRALASFERSLQIAPADPETLARVCYIYLKIGDEENAAAVLGRIAAMGSELVEVPGLADAVGFLKSPVSRFPRLLVANSGVAARVRKLYPRFIVEILEAVQRSALPRKGANPLLPAEFLKSVRARARVSWCALAVERAAGGWICIDSNAHQLYITENSAITTNLAAGGPGGALALARETAEPAIVLARESQPSLFLRPTSLGAAAVAVEAAGLPPAFLVMESEFTMEVDPLFLSKLGEEAVGPLCALWVARFAASQA